MTSTRLFPVGGRHRSKRASSSQLSKTSKRGSGPCQAAETSPTCSASGSLAKSGRRSKAPAPPQDAISAGMESGAPKLTQNTPPSKYRP